MPATTILGGELKTIAREAIANVGEILLPLKSFARTIETEKEGLMLNDTIQVFVAGDIPAAAEYDAANNNYGKDNGGSHAWKSVKLDKRFKQTFSIQEDQFRRAQTALSFSEFFKPYAQNVAIALSKNALAKLGTGGFDNKIAAGGAVAYDKSDAGKAETALAKLVGVGRPLNLVLSMSYFDGFRDSLSNLPANPTNNEVLRKGTIPGVAGFDLVMRTSMVPDIVDTTPAGEHNVGFATNGTGIIIANGVPSSTLDTNIDYEVAVCPVTGIAMAFSGYWNSDTRSYVATVETLTGVDVGDKKGILRIVETVA
jgi:hypothetical protein